MILDQNSTQETHYDILSVKENASYDEIRSSYRSAILNAHPDKLSEKSTNTTSHHNDTFLKIQKAWEVLSDSRSRTVYDYKLQASRHDAIITEDVSLENMMVEDGGDSGGGGGEEVVEFYHQCRCGDYFSVDSLELGFLGYKLTRGGGGGGGCEICVSTSGSEPVSIVLPCGSCSLLVCLSIGSVVNIRLDNHT